ncbi:HYC_CC_PP family protein [Sediminitomix flava]|uniref:Uncharacterized protein n=1 Tax=Sediminitomix flava TaxID=379075 RepID=A0A315Z8K0_SEDFL|nr:hypothetical protein [Sediminitomix flava]PWJ40988.1 hypothetical protein BC781_104254 [Sediminitomix flava]
MYRFSFLRKPFFHIVFAFAILFMASGLQLSLHYCGHMLVSVEAYAEESHSCCGSEDKKSDCCKNESKLFQIEEALQQVDIALDFPPILWMELPFSDHYLKVKELQFNKVYKYFTSYIPPPLVRSIHIIIQQFRL